MFDTGITNRTSNKGVSPVIGIILMITFTAILVGIASYVIGDELSDVEPWQIFGIFTISLLVSIVLDFVRMETGEVDIKKKNGRVIGKIIENNGFERILIESPNGLRRVIGDDKNNKASLDAGSGYYRIYGVKSDADEELIEKKLIKFD